MTTPTMTDEEAIALAGVSRELTAEELTSIEAWSKRFAGDSVDADGDPEALKAHPLAKAIQAALKGRVIVNLRALQANGVSTRLAMILKANQDGPVPPGSV